MAKIQISDLVPQENACGFMAEGHEPDSLMNSIVGGFNEFGFNISEDGTIDFMLDLGDLFSDFGGDEVDFFE